MMPVRITLTRTLYWMCIQSTYVHALRVNNSQPMTNLRQLEIVSYVKPYGSKLRRTSPAMHQEDPRAPTPRVEVDSG
jgi:hypothetical protein